MLVGPIILLKVVSGTSLQFEILLRRPRCADARNVSFSPLYGGQFTSSTQLIKPSISSDTYHRRSTSVSFQTYLLYLKVVMRRKYSEKVFRLLNSVSKYYIHQSLFSQEKHYRHGNHNSTVK